MNLYIDILNNSLFIMNWFNIIIIEYKIITLNKEFVKSVISKIEGISMIWNSDDDVDNCDKWWMILDGFSDHNPDSCQSASILLLIIINRRALI